MQVWIRLRGTCLHWLIDCLSWWWCSVGVTKVLAPLTWRYESLVFLFSTIIILWHWNLYKAMSLLESERHDLTWTLYEVKVEVQEHWDLELEMNNDSDISFIVMGISSIPISLSLTMFVQVCCRFPSLLLFFNSQKNFLSILLNWV